MTPMPITQLSNGLRVGNLSSGHSFEFEDGSVLAACQNDRVEAGKLDIVDTQSPVQLYRRGLVLNFRCIEMMISVSPSIKQLLDDARLQWREHEVDIVIVPLMLQEALKKLLSGERDRWLHFCFVIRKNGRDVDGQRAKICIDRFCV